MGRPPGHTAGSSKLPAAIPFQRAWPASLVLVIAVILLWFALSQPVHKTSDDAHPSTKPGRMKSAGAMERSVATTQGRKPLPPGGEIIGDLPSHIEHYLEIVDDEQADVLLPSVCALIGPKEVKTLALCFDQTSPAYAPSRILGLLSHLQNPEALDAAKKIVLHLERPVDDPLLLACATSLAKYGKEDEIEAVLHRLNQVPPHDSNAPHDPSSALAHSLSLVSGPELEWFIGQAAEGKWASTSETSRLAAIRALRSYPSTHTTMILVRLRDHDDSPEIRKGTAEILRHIQTPESE